MDLDIGAEFVFMAATLIHIKSRMLLPADPALRKEGEPEDPREELVQRLLEHERFKNAAEMLQQKRIIEENVWSNPQMKQFVAEDEDPGLAVSLFDLVKAFGEVLERVARTARLRSQRRRNFRRRYGWPCSLPAAATRKDKPLFILQVMERQRTRPAMICLFLAVLEMVKMQTVQILQADLFGEIALAKGERFDETRPAPDAYGRRIPNRGISSRRMEESAKNRRTIGPTSCWQKSPPRQRFTMEDAKLKAVLEAIIYVTDEPLSLTRSASPSSSRASA